MGEVYRATDPTLQRTVALKTVRPDIQQPQLLSRLIREAQALARLQHPNIVTVHEAGEFDGVVFIAMEFLKGEDLETTLRRGGPGFAGKVQILIQVLAALEHAHAEGVIHRDIKPSNIFRLPDGTIKLVDFGLARVAQAETVTLTGAVMATVAYASPEQLKGQPLDPRTDIYSVGAVAYELCTGRRAFVDKNDTATAIILKVVNDPLPPMDVAWSRQFPEYERIVARAMSKSREDRFQSAREMREALTAFLETSQAALTAFREDATVVLDAETQPAAPPPGQTSLRDERTVVAGAPNAGLSARTTQAADRKVPGEQTVDLQPATPLTRSVSPGVWALGGIAAVGILAALLMWPRSEGALPTETAAPSGPSVESASALPSAAPSVATPGADAATPDAAIPPATTPAAAAAPPPAARASAETAVAVGAAAKVTPPVPSASAAPAAAPADTSASAKKLFYGESGSAPSPADSGGATPATNAGLKFRLVQQAGAGEIDVDPESTFRSGDRVRFMFESNIDGYLYVVTQGSTGRWDVLFPNASVNGGRNAIRPLEAYRVPAQGWFRFDDNPGTEQVFVFLSKEPLAQLPGFSQPVTKAETLSASVVDDLQRRVQSRDLIWEEDQSQRAASGTPTQATYIVNRDELGKAVAATIRLTHGR
jgi:serine/threonine-protein kinase